MKDDARAVSGLFLAVLMAVALSIRPAFCRDDLIVSSPEEFHRALALVEAGQAISLRPGTYGNLSIRGLDRGGFIVIRSFEPRRPAQISALEIKASAYLRLKHLSFAAQSGEGGKVPYAIVTVRRSRAIEVSGSTFQGSVDGDYNNDPVGATFREVDDLKFVGNDLHDLARGVVLGGVRRARISRNQFANLRSDGANFVGVQSIVIERNVFHSFHPLPDDHPDFIQFWQRNALIEDTRDVVIRGNTLLQRADRPIQGIFVGNKISGRLYRNFVIEDNVIHVSSFHGISLYDMMNARVANNTLVTFPGSTRSPRINLIRTRAAQVIANVAPILKQDQAENVTLACNVFTDGDPGESQLDPARLFVDPAAGADAKGSGFEPLPGGLLDRPECGRIGALPPRADLVDRRR